MTNEEIMKLLKEHEEHKASGKPFTDEEYAEADAEEKKNMRDAGRANYGVHFVMPEF